MFAYVLTVKGQIGCMGVLLYIAWTYFSVKRKGNMAHKIFSLLLTASIINIIFDMVTVYTINHVHEISMELNHFLHIIYMSSMASAMYFFFLYIRNLAYGNKKLKFYHLIPLIIAILGSIFLKFDYVESPYGNYSWGPYATVAFISAYFYLLCSAYMLIRRWDHMEKKTRRSIGISMVFMLTNAVLQGMYPELLITSISLTLINIALFYTVESPDAILIEKLRDEQKKSESANRAKSVFLAQMSHEIRTPINAVLGMNEMILREADDSDIKEYASNIKEAGTTLLSIINSILDFSKIEDNKMELLSVEYETAKLINNLVNSIYNRARSKGLYFEIDIDNELPSILIGDDVRLTQVIMNLLTNAVKYTEKGTVTLMMQKVSCDNQSVDIRVTVKDTGIGIKQEDMKGIFDSFQRLDEEQNRNIEGTGLGMAIVTRLLTMMGSKIEVESEYGKGSTFSFCITQNVKDATPIGDYKKALEEHRKENITEIQFTAPEARILIVDDNLMNHKVAENLLKLFRIEPDHAISGAEGIEYVKKKQYDIICLDHMMPEMDGIETLERMRSENLLPKNTVVLVMTANAVVGAKEMYLEKGFDDYISKPIEMEVLINKIRTYLPKELIIDVGVQAEQKTSEAESDSDILEFAPVSEETKESNTYDGLERLDNLKKLGIDVSQGLAHCADDTEFYLEILSDFCESQKEKCDELEKFLSTGRFEEYGIKAHAIKGNARTLGIVALADVALGMEQAAKNKEFEYIRNNHEAFISEYERITENIKKS